MERIPNGSHSVSCRKTSPGLCRNSWKKSGGRELQNNVLVSSMIQPRRGEGEANSDSVTKLVTYRGGLFPATREYVGGCDKCL